VACLLQQNRSTARLFTDGHFYNKSGTSSVIALELKKPQQQTQKNFPFVLNSGRIRDSGIP